ncbi:MAG TPA: hypothetical protein VG389_06960 [Myxococcota bacterium]|nr:hypothetical protein [Myxococcota bacterium]
MSAALGLLLALPAWTALGAEPASAAAAAPGWRVPAAVGLSGAAVVCAGAGVAFALALAHAQNEYDRAPNESLDELRTLDRLAHRGHAYAALADTSFVVAGVAAAGAVALWVLVLRHRSATSLPPPVEAGAGGLVVRW